MQKNPRNLLWVGLVLLLVGGFLSYGPGSGAAGANAASEAACRTEMASRGPEGKAMADQCAEANFAIAVTATDANSAAAAIGGNNQSEILGGMLGQFLLGMGAVLTLAGILIPLIRKNRD